MFAERFAAQMGFAGIESTQPARGRPTPHRRASTDGIGIDRVHRDRRPPPSRMDQGPRPGRRGLRRHQARGPRARPAHRLRGGALSERGRVLGPQDGDVHAARRRLHAQLRLLRRRPRQAGRASIRTSPTRVAEGVARLGLRHVVVTSVDRDDLPDGGAGHFAATAGAIKQRVPGVCRRGADAGLQGEPRRARARGRFADRHLQPQHRDRAAPLSPRPAGRASTSARWICSTRRSAGAPACSPRPG